MSKNIVAGLTIKSNRLMLANASPQVGRCIVQSPYLDMVETGSRCRSLDLIFSLFCGFFFSYVFGNKKKDIFPFVWSFQCLIGQGYRESISIQSWKIRKGSGPSTLY